MPCTVPSTTHGDNQVCSATLRYRNCAWKGFGSTPQLFARAACSGDNSLLGDPAKSLQGQTRRKRARKMMMQHFCVISHLQVLPLFYYWAAATVKGIRGFLLPG